MRDVEVEAGGRKLIFTMSEAKEWVAAGFARWVGRNKLRITSRCEAKPVLRGVSLVIGETALGALNEVWAQTFIEHLFRKREISATK
jgi:hypothetical protein